MDLQRECDGPSPSKFGIEQDQGRTDLANAERFIDKFHSELLYVPPWKSWLSWDGSRWIQDGGVGALQRASRYARSLWESLESIAMHSDRKELDKVVTFLKSTSQTAKIRAFMELATVDERVVCLVDELNSDPTILNVANGTVDLTSGKIRPHNPADRITQMANVVYDPDAKCPKWRKTLDLIFAGNQELVRYCQQLLGYSLSGETGEHILPIAYGKGCNGKSTIWNVVADLLGDYATLANDDLLMGEKSNHPTEKASLYQKRFVAISEPEHGANLRESRVKELTGDRSITARRMHEDFWTFERTHTFWISSNHLPKIRGLDEGIWRRVKLIPFEVDLRTVTDPIPDFDKWLIAHEGPGILAWLVQGYLDYRANGLIEPQAVTAATQDYRDDSDTLGQFVREYCVESSDEHVVASELFKAYSEDFGGKSKQTTFGKAMGERYEKRKSHGKIVYQGIRLRTPKDDEPELNPIQKTQRFPHPGRVREGLGSPPSNSANSIEQWNNPPSPSLDSVQDDPGVTF